MWKRANPSCLRGVAPSQERELKSSGDWAEIPVACRSFTGA